MWCVEKQQIWMLLYKRMAAVCVRWYDIVKRSKPKHPRAVWEIVEQVVHA